jgi:hypothetical protein
MLVAEQLMQTQKQFEKTLTLIDQFIWPAAETVDTNTKIFFVFKPYPKQLKRKQIEQWALLQCTALSPFIGGQHYQYLSKAGLHLWICRDKFHGVPETAMQNAMPDGSHRVVSASHHYQQTWRDGLLIGCFTANPSDDPDSGAALTLHINKRTPWAVTRKIDQQLKKPSIWLGVSAFIGLCATVWFAAAYVTLGIQRHNAEQNIVAMQTSLGEKLAEQTKLQNQQQNLLTLQNWHNEFGFLPESFAAIVEKISLQGNWKANSISWQNRLLSVELSAQNLDIAKLVAELESLPSLAQINIRPHLAENTWVIEAAVK